MYLELSTSFWLPCLLVRTYLDTLQKLASRNSHSHLQSLWNFNHRHRHHGHLDSYLTQPLVLQANDKLSYMDPLSCNEAPPVILQPPMAHFSDHCLQSAHIPR